MILDDSNRKIPVETMKGRSSSNTSNIAAQVIDNGFADNISVLHVDDEDIFLKATKIYLEENTKGKIKVDSLINPEQVFRQLEEKMYDVIVADYRMPSTDGLQLLKQLRNKNVTIPFIMFTGLGGEEIASQALNLGANRYIKKGLDTKSQFNELIHAIQEEVDHKRTQDALEESKQNFLDLSENSPDGIVIVDENIQHIYVNKVFSEITGYNKDELLSMTGWDITRPEDIEKYKERMEQRLAGKPHKRRYERIFVRKDGSEVFVEMITTTITWRGKTCPMAVVRDITDRKQAEVKIHHLNLVLKTIRSINQLIVKEKNRNKLLSDICKILIENRDYTHAWIALLDMLGGLEFSIEAGLGKDFSQLSKQMEQGEWPSCIQNVLTQSNIIIIDNPSASCIDCPLRIRYEENSSMAIRLAYEERIYGILSVSSPLNFAEDEEEQSLFLELAQDIALALKNFELEEKNTDQAIQAAREYTENLVETLRKERDLAKKYLDIAGVIMIAIDVNQCISLVNKKGCEILGYEEKDILGKNWFDTFFPKRIQEEVKTVYNKLLAGEIEPVEYFENPVVVKSGEERIIVWHNNILKDDEGNIIGTLSSGEDITEHKQVEEALKTSKELYQDLYENAPDMYASVDPRTTTIIRCNQTLATYLGYTKEEIIGKSVFEIYHPDCMEDVKKTLQIFTKTGEVHDSELQLKRKDGGKVNVSLNVSAVRDEQGDILYSRSALRDIKQIKKIQNELQESEERYRSFVQNFLGIAYRGKMDFTPIFLHGLVEELTGYREDEFIAGKPRWDQVIHKEDLPTLLEEAKLIRSTPNYSAGREYRIIRKDGQIIWVYELIQNICDDSGKPIFVQGTIYEITERTQVQKELQEEREKYQMLVEKLEEGVLLEDREGVISFVNQKTTDLLGYTENELLGKHWTYIVPPEAIDKAKIESKKRSKGISSKYEIDLQVKDSTLKPVIVSATPIFSESGEFSGVLSVFTDISEQKQIERKLIETKIRLEYLLKSSPAVIYTCELKAPYGVTFISENVKELTGYESQEYLADPTFMDNKIHPDDRERTIAALNNISKQSKFVSIYRFQHKNGSYRWMYEEVRLILDEHGKILDRIGYWSDITEQKQAEQNLQIVNKELQDFASIVAHDLKTPLRNLKTLAGWLLRDYADDLNEGGKDHLVSLIKQTIHMDALIDGIYRYSKIDRFYKEIMRINLNDLLSEIVDLLSPPDNIKVNIQAELPILAVDQTHITQIFSNLIDNAIKFMDKPKGHVDINCEEKKNLWQFSVADTGPGIEESHFERIFQMFQTLSSWDETKNTGIGLAIVKKIVELNGGEVWLESSVGKGSTFYFTLPKG